nr:MAK10-like protein [Tanacetum cinerariifolium]
MGDANPIRTLRDYSKPSHEGYSNTIELPIGNNVVPLRSDTIREAPSFDEPEPQPNPLPNYPSLDVWLGKERGSKPPNKPYSLDGFKMKEVDHLTIHTLTSHLSTLRHNGSLGVDFSKMEMIENEWELEAKEVYFLERGLNSPVWPKMVENVRIKETHHLKHTIQQPIFSACDPFSRQCMGDANPIHTLEDYSKPSHKGYMNTIDLPEGNNVVPLRSKIIRLVQNECSFHGLWSEDPNQHLKDFLKLVDSLDLDVANRERMRLPKGPGFVLGKGSWVSGVSGE